ncbi:hypothetical protein M4951_25610 [Blastopirellula sp. J2-11]|uniref:hypothetical protein n=1 Tax=Blastopirellula sp. J2-11 TaxID=2943192 RepID=UPI0021C85DEE|nr:hypothetical protein [Blastopirellula sp. J2-11]UUO06707.1 hypothetical protein M4951_25610 [Blastopirellula sp. J2-11]
MRILFTLCFVLAIAGIVAADQELDYRTAGNIRLVKGPFYFLSLSTRRCIPPILETPEQRKRQIHFSADLVTPLRPPINWLNLTPGRSLIGEEEEFKLGLGDLN